MATIATYTACATHTANATIATIRRTLLPMPGKRPRGRSFFYVPAMQPDPTAGGHRPEGCCCAWAEIGPDWVKGDDNTRCTVHTPQPKEDT
jgi:hypothetical protein